MKKLNIKSAYRLMVASGVLAIALFAFAGSASAFANPATVNLGEAGNFAVLSSTAISDVPTSVITGDIGVSPAGGAAITGFTCPAVTGTVHVVSAGGPTLLCQTVDPLYLTPTVLEYEAAYTDASGRIPDALITTALDGLTYTPGIYSAANLDLGSSSDVTLDCGGDANGVFIFQTAGHLNIGTNAHVNLIGSCQPGNVFWAVAGTTDILGGIGTESTFQGTVLGGQGTTEISLGVGSTVLGRLMSDKTISLQSNIITASTPIVILDTTIPVITLVGSTPVNLTVGDSYTDVGATASDDVDGDITPSIVVGGDIVDTAIVGVYVITYNAQDSSSNSAIEVTRTVNVSAVPVPAPTPTPPPVSHGGGGITYCSATVTTFCRPVSGFTPVTTTYSGVGQVLGAATVNSTVIDAQIASIKGQLVTLIQQLINKLQAQTVAMQSVPGFPNTGWALRSY